MNFQSVYRLSFYLMLVLGACTLSLDVGDRALAPLYPIGVAVASFVAYVFVDERNRPLVPRDVGNLLALATVVLAFLDYNVSGDANLSLGHWLVYLQIVKILLPKNVRDDWSLILLGLTQVLIGAVISPSDQVGFLLLAWVVVSLWVLGLFALRRDSIRARALADKNLGATVSIIEAPASERLAPASLVREGPYAGLVDTPFLISTARVAITTLALGGIIFLAMPRRGAGASRRSAEPIASHLTGFDDQVKLGQLGEILENDSVVMSVESFDEQTGNRVELEGEPLWRGVTLGAYENGVWRRQSPDSATFPIAPVPGATKRRILRVQIKLEANDSNVLFGLRPMLEVGPDSLEAQLNPNDGTIFRENTRGGTIDYFIRAERADPRLQRGETLPTNPQRGALLGIPAKLVEPLRAVADPIVENIPAADVEGRARALENYLRSSGQFAYSLQMKIDDPSLDPVLDFLVNRKVGHCEYFASALALLLRAEHIPARLVNGFKGGDWNSIAQVTNVRQKHAHSWVEAYLGGDEVHRPLWLTLDPTPGNQRDASVAKVGGFPANFRQFTDLVRYVWVFYIIGFNPERQQRILYQPVLALAREAARGFAIMGQTVKQWIHDLLHFPTVVSFFTIRGFVVSFSVLLLIAAGLRAAHWLARRLWNRFSGETRDDGALLAGVVFYRRLAHLLAGYGLSRPASETQGEFARRAAVFLAGKGLETEDVADVPAAVVDAFYGVRFGRQTLELDTLRALESRLDALEAALDATRAH